MAAKFDKPHIKFREGLWICTVYCSQSWTHIRQCGDSPVQAYERATALRDFHEFCFKHNYT